MVITRNVLFAVLSLKSNRKLLLFLESENKQTQKATDNYLKTDRRTVKTNSILSLDGGMMDG